ncbi:MAG: hypothetical protein HUK22_01795, partial [Thermoguttaceae bacterium]|nr:hypothetical protein [Thermoguttaceae bacterium]
MATKLDAALDSIDARYLSSVALASSETNAPVENETFFAEIADENDAVDAAAAQFMALASQNADTDNSTPGYLFINPNPTRQEIVWETRPTGGDASDEIVAQAPKVSDFNQAEIKIKTYSLPNAATELRRHRAVLPPLTTFWIPQISGVEYQFLKKPPFDLGSLDDVPENVEQDEEIVASLTLASQKAAIPHKPQSFLGKLTKKIQTATAISTRKSGAVADSERLDASKRSHLAEFVEMRYSAKEIERYYSLQNDIFELRIDPTTGAVNRLTTLNTDAPIVGHGILRQPSRGNRFAS